MRHIIGDLPLAESLVVAVAEAAAAETFAA
jgi:hypothetical protein